MIRHHPEEELLLALAAGRATAGQAIVLGTHLEHCVHCRERLHTMQAVGGALLEGVEPVAMGSDAMQRTLQRIDTAPALAEPPRTHAKKPALPNGMPWPASMRATRVCGWRWMGPDMRYARVEVPHETTGSVFVLRIGEGRSLPVHTHGGIELTQVLCGSFDDGRALFAPGDFDLADESIHHQPIVRPGETCVCLAYVGAPLKFDGRIASFMGGLIGI